MAFPRDGYELEHTQGHWYVVVRERGIQMQGHDGVTMEITKRVGPFSTQDHARRFANADNPVRYWEKFGDIYDEDGVYLGSTLRQAAKRLGIVHSGVKARVMNMPDGRRVIRSKRSASDQPRSAQSDHAVSTRVVTNRVVTEEGRYLGSSVNSAAKQLGITRPAVYARVVNRHEDGTIVVKISGIRRKKDGRVEVV